MAAFQPDQDFEARVRDSFARQVVMKTIGCELTQVSAGTIEIEMPFNPSLVQQHGFLHAGIISTALDSACGYAAYSLMPADAAVLTIEFKVNMLAPGKGNATPFMIGRTSRGVTTISSSFSRCW